MNNAMDHVKKYTNPKGISFWVVRCPKGHAWGSACQELLGRYGGNYTCCLELPEESFKKRDMLNKILRYNT